MSLFYHSSTCLDHGGASSLDSPGWVQSTLPWPALAVMFTVDILVETVTFSSLKHLLGPWRTSFLDLCTDTLPALADLPALLVTLQLDDSVPDEKGLVGLYTGQTSSLLKSKSV